MAGLQNFKIDQAGTFAKVIFLESAPKLRFGSDQQDMLKDGTPKWEVQVLGGFRNQFGQVSNEVVKISVAAPRDPAQGLEPYTPVQLVDFEVGVMADERKDRETGEKKIVGAKVWFKASEVRSTAETAPAGKRSTAAESKAA